MEEASAPVRPGRGARTSVPVTQGVRGAVTIRYTSGSLDTLRFVCVPGGSTRAALAERSERERVVQSERWPHGQ